MRNLCHNLQLASYGASLVLIGSVPGLSVELTDSPLGSINRLIGGLVCLLWLLAVVAAGRLRRPHVFPLRGSRLRRLVRPQPLVERGPRRVAFSDGCRSRRFTHGHTVGHLSDKAPRRNRDAGLPAGRLHLGRDDALETMPRAIKPGSGSKGSPERASTRTTLPCCSRSVFRWPPISLAARTARGFSAG